MKKKIVAPILFLLGLGLCLLPILSQKYYQIQQQVTVDRQIHELADLPEEEKGSLLEDLRKCNESIFIQNEKVADPFAETDAYDGWEVCVDSPAEGPFFSSLEIPKLKEKLPIYIGASQANLAKGVGQVEGSSLPGGGRNTHMVLAGHRGMWTKAMFRHLDELHIGDHFLIHLLDQPLTYEVYDVQVILPYETESLLIREGKDLVSLITCHPYGNNTHRLVVYGERVMK